MSETKFIDMMKAIQERMKLPKTYLGKSLTSEELSALSIFSVNLYGTIDPDIIVDTLKGFEKKKIPFDNILYIGYAVSFGFDRTVYENPALSKDQLIYILYGDLLGVNVSVYANEKFTSFQMITLLSGLISGIDVRPYADPSFSVSQMREIQDAIKDGFEIMDYVGVDSYAEKIHTIHSLLKIGRDKNVDVVKYLNMPFNYRQLREIEEGLLDDLDVSIYADPKFTVEQMNSILDGLREGVDVSVYANPKYSYRKMDLIKLFLIKNIPVDFDKIPDNLKKDILRYMIKFIRYGVNPEKYLNYKIGQLYEITKGLKEGLDISQFDDISLSKDEMKKIRQKLYNEKMSKYQAI